MEQHRRRAALVALRLVSQESWADSELAGAFGTHAAAAEATSYLAGFLVQMLALHRGEGVPDTVRFVRHLLERGDEGSAGVR